MSEAHGHSIKAYSEIISDATAHLYTEAAVLSSGLIGDEGYASISQSRQRREGGPAIPDGYVRIRIDGSWPDHPRQLEPFWFAYDGVVRIWRQAQAAAQGAPAVGRHVAKS